MRLIDIDSLITEIRDEGNPEADWSPYEIVALLEHNYEYQSEHG